MAWLLLWGLAGKQPLWLALAMLLSCAGLGGVFVVRRWRRIRSCRSLWNRGIDEGLESLTPDEFEHFCLVLFANMGYSVDHTGGRGDHGVDLRLRQGTDLALAQCKRYQGTVGEPVLRDLYGSMAAAGAQRGFIVTTGRFSRSAHRWAQGKPMMLVDGGSVKRLCGLVQAGTATLDWGQSARWLRPAEAVLASALGDERRQPIR